MLHRFALIALFIAACNPAGKPATDNGYTGPDAGPVTDASPGSDAGPGHNCGGACPDAGMGSDGGMGSGSAGGTVKLGPAQTYTTDNAATWVTAGDLDGDGVLDLAVSCPDDANGTTYLDVLRGNGSGAFTYVNHVKTADPAQSVIADFNRDGIADIAAIDWDGMGPFYEKYLQGLGGLQYSVSNWGNLTDYFEYLSAGDFDGDGTPEVVAAWTDSQNPMSTQGGFIITKLPGGTTLQSEVAFGHDTLQAIAGDFNGDGHQDVVVSSSAASALKLYLGNGSTVTFASDVTLPGGAIRTIIAADFDRDGRTDVAALHVDGTVTVSYGTTLGLSSPRSFSINTVWGRGIAAGDFDHDGRLDLAVGDITADPNLVRIYLATDTGFVHAKDINVSYVGFTFAVGDFNGDGFDDLAVPSFTTVSVLLSTP